MNILFILLTFPISIPMIVFSEVAPILYHRIGESLPYHPRIINWVWAAWGRFFWLPCPICGKNFGGHEKGGSLYYTNYSGEMVCPKCIEKADERNKKTFEMMRQEPKVVNIRKGL